MKKEKVTTKKTDSTALKIKRRLDGVVVGDKMDKTITVKVSAVKIHPMYKKRYFTCEKYKAHDEKNEAKIDDKVTIELCRPISRDKRWRLISINK